MLIPLIIHRFVRKMGISPRESLLPFLTFPSVLHLFSRFEQNVQDPKPYLSGLILNIRHILEVSVRKVGMSRFQQCLGEMES